VFDVPSCAKAVPLLRSAYAQLKSLPANVADKHSPQAFIALIWAHCLLEVDEYRKAAKLLRLAADTRDWANVTIRAEARARLADLYRTGRGVPRDPERALALYTLGGFQSDPQRSDSRLQAADVTLELSPNERNKAYPLLEEGRLRNWWRSIRMREDANENPYTNARIMLSAIDNGVVLDDEDRAALREIHLRLGQLFLAERQRAAAYAHLLQADPGPAARSLEALRQQQPYRLVSGDRAAQTRVAGSSGQIDQCVRLQSSQEAAARDLRGVESPMPSPPEGMDADVLATQLSGQLAKGGLWPVAGGEGDWLLVGDRARINPTQLDVIIDRSDAPIIVALLHWQPAHGENDKPVVTVLAQTSNVIPESQRVDDPTADRDITMQAASDVECIDP
jgi:hypothetical protein